MKKSAYALVSLTALAAVLHADSQHILRASFPDGTGLEIFKRPVLRRSTQKAGWALGRASGPRIL